MQSNTTVTSMKVLMVSFCQVCFREALNQLYGHFWVYREVYPPSLIYTTENECDALDCLSYDKQEYFGPI